MSGVGFADHVGVHVRLQWRGDEDRAVGLLVGFKQSDQQPRHCTGRPIHSVNKPVVCNTSCAEDITLEFWSQDIHS